MIDAIVDQRPRKVLDIGCGEGWLVRELMRRGIDAAGIDFVPDLVAAACRAGGSFRLLGYRELAAHAKELAADVTVCNFSLLGDASTREVFAAMTGLLGEHGRFIVQTLHPAGVPGEDGWREGSWQGFSDDFVDPHPWYFRSEPGWRRLFDDYGLEIVDTRAPDDGDGRPASLLFIARPRSNEAD